MPVPPRPEDDWGRPVDEAHDGGRNGESILDRDWWLHTCLRQGPPAPSPAREPEPHPEIEPDHEIEPNYNVEPDHETEPNYNVEPEATTRVAAATTADDEKPPF